MNNTKENALIKAFNITHKMIEQGAKSFSFNIDLDDEEAEFKIVLKQKKSQPETRESNGWSAYDSLLNDPDPLTVDAKPALIIEHHDGSNEITEMTFNSIEEYKRWVEEMYR